MALVTAEVTWLRCLLADFSVFVSMPSRLLTDSTNSVSIAHDLWSSMSLLSIWVLMPISRVHRFRMMYVPLKFQLADFLTKVQTRAQHRFYLSKLGVSNPPGVWGGGC